MLLDGNSIFNRAYYALPVLNDKGGKNINAVYGFMNILVKAMTELNPTHIAVRLTSAGTTSARIFIRDTRRRDVPCPTIWQDRCPSCRSFLPT